MLILRDLYVRYKKSRYPALNKISFEHNKPGILLIAGRSGGGKSTLARCLFGLIPHFFDAEVHGYINILGINPIKTGPQPLARKVGFVSQNPEMFISALTVEEEIISPLSNTGVIREEMINRLKKLAEIFELGGILDKPTLEISAGQMQKVAIASALALDPKILVLDEPFARLDGYNSLLVLRILQKIAKEKLVIIFEHHLDFVLPYADRVIVLEAGRIIADGKPSDVITFLEDVDLPEITEAFLEFKRMIDKIPLTPNEALEVIKNYTIKKRLV